MNTKTIKTSEARVKDDAAFVGSADDEEGRRIERRLQKEGKRIGAQGKHTTERKKECSARS